MADKVSRKKGAFLERKTVAVAVAALLVLGLGLLLWGAGGEEQKAVDSSAQVVNELIEYSEYLEGQVRKLCENVDGVSAVTVSITLEGGFEQTYATDRQFTPNGQNIEYVKVGSGASSHLCSTGFIAPTIAGIGICCKGCEDSATRAELTALVAAAFGVGSNKIYIAEAG